MEILLTGNTCFVTPAWVEMAFPEDHVLITCARGQPHPPRIRTITLDSKERIGQLVDSYEFDRIVYFSEYLTPHSEQEGELDRLRRVLQANRERPSQLLYLAGPEAVLTPFIGKSVLAQAAEALCRHYAETSRVQIKVLHLPYLYGTDCTGAPVGIAQLLTRPKSGELHFEEQALAPVAALCMEDLSELVLRVFDNWTPEWESLTAPVVFHWNYEQLGEAWKALCPGLTVTYGSDLIREYPPDDGQLRRAYGWFPRYDLLDDLPRFFRQEKQPRRKKWPERFSSFAARHRLLVPVLELLGAWGVSELLVRMTSTQAQFRVVDFRLAFIVLIADVYGLNAGVAAAFLASLSLAAGYWAEGASPLRFVRQLYQDTLEDKRSFRRQILGRRDSFGKVYAVTKALDAAPAQELPRKIVEVLEDVLENHSAAVYRVDARRHLARRAACSADFAARCPQLLEGTGLGPVLRGIEQDGLWVNRELTPGLPMFGAAVRENGELRALILLHDASGEQLSLYYQNMFRILCGLAETAMVRAGTKPAAKQEVRV